MASAEFGKDTEHKRPNVQVGDPFKEKLLLEACLEVMDRGLIVGIQDMGAAGLTCSTTEMAAKGGMGIDIDLDQVPQREAGMTPYEILLSESQERMLHRGHAGEGRSRPGRLRQMGPRRVGHRRGHRGRPGPQCSFQGEVVVDIPVDAVVNLCPAYDRPIAAPAPPAAGAGSPKRCPGRPISARPCSRLLASPSIADKEWVFRQYDHMVQVNTVFLPGADAAVLRIKGSRAGPGHDPGRQLPLHPPRSADGGQDRRGRSLPEPGLRRRPADRRHQLPELRQSRKARGHGPVRGGRRRAGRGLPDVRHPGHGRERQLLQRHRRAVHPSDARPGRRRPHRGHRQGRPARDSGPPGTPSSSSARASTSSAAPEYLKTIHGLEAGSPPTIDLEQEKRRPGIRPRGDRGRARPFGPRPLRGRAGRGPRRVRLPQPEEDRLRGRARGAACATTPCSSANRSPASS